MSDFLSGGHGIARNYNNLGGLRAKLDDLLYDLALLISPKLKSLHKGRKAAAAERVLVVGINVQTRPGDILKVTAQLGSDRHEVIVSVTDMQAKGKFENIEDAILDCGRPLSSFDWLIIVDDDVALPKGFLDGYLEIAKALDLSLSQPAHKFASHASYAVTQRRWGTIARETRFVEIGPLTVVRAAAFKLIVPFPKSRWCYGVDAFWSEEMARAGLRCGVVDALPIRHLRPVAASYDMRQAAEEGEALMKRLGVEVSRETMFADEGRRLPLWG
jgi:hypothetical protein